MPSNHHRFRAYERSLLLRFSAIGFAITIAMAAVLGYAIQARLVHDALLSATDIAVTHVTTVVRPLITTADITSPLSPELHGRLDALTARSLEAGGVVRIKIWNRDGVVIYSDADEQVGYRDARNAGVLEALRGKITSQHVDLTEPEHVAERQWSSLHEVYIPLRAADSDEILGAYEIYHTSERLDGSIEGIQRIIAIGVFGGFGILYLALFGVVFGAARRLVERARENTRLTGEVTQAYDDAIEGWGRALDLKDHETEGHSQRVTELAVEIAARLDMTPAEMVAVKRGSLLHDIGKMGVPDEILNKPGALTEDEWVVMRAHTVNARDMLRGMGYLATALDIPVHHHERWDGTGYPDGLAGEAIPRAARIFAVVDVWDALTNDRPYRAAWSAERALSHIGAGAGSHFDPEAVRAFMEVVSIREAQVDEEQSRGSA